MPWEQVQTVIAAAPVTVVLRDGQQVQSTLETLDKGEITAIRNAAEQRMYERMLHPRLYELWVGTGTFGLAGTTGNSQTRVTNGALAVARATRHDKTILHLDAIQSTSTVNRLRADTARAIRGGIGYDRNVGPRLFVNVFNDYEYDRFQDLDLRATFGGGLGLHVWKKERGFLDVLAGADYNRTTFGATRTLASIGKSYTQSSAELFWGNDFAYKLRPATAFTQTFRMFNNVSQTGNYRMNGDIGVNTRIMKWLNWNIALSDRYLTNPAPGRKTNDLIYTTGLGISFSLR